MKSVKILGRALSLVPAKYWLGAAGTAIALIGAGIVKTATTSPVPKIEAKLEAREQKPLMEVPAPSAVPPAIGEGNLFRRQRTDHRPPPPTPLDDPNEPVPDVKLLGVIVTDTKRLAILDATVMKYIRREVYDDLVISGVRQDPTLTPEGKVLKITPLKGDTLASQTFNEGDIVSEYTLDRINEDSIELASRASGKRTVIYIDPDDAASTFSGRMSSATKRTDEVDKRLFMSGAVTR